ncbi:hypothetical protein HK405_014518 [Cladochytrium tenue]|nr:hypothetical protein HK405_014518 [Cladochytrium tenue]
MVADLDDGAGGVALDADDLSAVRDALPTRDEAAKIRAHVTAASAKQSRATGVGPSLPSPPPLPPLGPAEAFMARTLEVRGFAARLEAMAAKAGVPGDVAEAAGRVRAVTEACATVRGSEALRTLLAAVLRMGRLADDDGSGGGGDGVVDSVAKSATSTNAAPATAVAPAAGFRIGVLARLGDVRSADGRWTLASFLVDSVARARPDVAKAAADLARCVRAARRVDLDEVASRLAAAERAVARADACAAQLRDEGDSGGNGAVDGVEAAAGRLQAFVAEARGALASARVDFAALDAEWRRAAAYLGEDAADYASVAELVERAWPSTSGQPGGNGGTAMLTTAAAAAAARKQPPLQLLAPIEALLQGFEVMPAGSHGRALAPSRSR